MGSMASTGTGTLVGQELVAGLGTVLLPTRGDLAVDLEQDLDRGELARLVHRAGFQAQETDPQVTLGEAAQPLLPHALRALRQPVRRPPGSSR